MSFDIDMEIYGRDAAPVAAEQRSVDTNFYQQEVGEHPIHPELMEQPKVEPSEEKPEANPQAEHFRALRDEVDRIKAERESEKREHQLQLDMLRANLAETKQSVRQSEPQRRNEMFEGMKDDDIPNVAELRREWSQRESAYQAKLEELQVQQLYPDYAEVIEKFALPLVKQKPHLAEGLHGAQNKALFAYEIGKMAQHMQTPSQPEPPKVSDSAKRIVENSRKPGTLSQAGGQSTLSKADYFATMSDQEFMRMASRNLEGI